LNTLTTEREKDLQKLTELEQKRKERQKELKEKDEKIKNQSETIADYANEIKKTYVKNSELAQELSKSKERVKELVKNNSLLVLKYTGLENSYKKQEQKLVETDKLLQAEKEKNQILEEKYEELKNNSDLPTNPFLGE
jgi:hypothetical protein